jgi:hypothetical protein
MTDESPLAKALAELANQKTPNYLATAKKHKVDRNTLRRHFLRQSEDAIDGHLNAQGRLTANQEDALIDWIHELSKRKLPPTPGMIKGYVERIIDEPVGKNWVSNFYKRYPERLKRKYLRGMDANRVYSTARKECFQIWYQNVRNSASFA